MIGKVKGKENENLSSLIVQAENYTRIGRPPKQERERKYFLLQGQEQWVSTRISSAELSFRIPEVRFKKKFKFIRAYKQDNDFYLMLCVSEKRGSYSKRYIRT
jgi:hypothetical protein